VATTCLLVLRRWGCAEHLGAAGLVKAAVQPDHADGFQQPGRAHAGGVAGVLRLVEADTHVTLRAEVVHLVRRYAGQQGDQP